MMIRTDAFSAAAAQRCLSALALFFAAAFSLAAQETKTENKPAPPKPPSEAGTMGVREVAAYGMERTVGISCRRGESQSYYGTGAVISPSGHILTSTTVVPPGAREIEVVFPGFHTHKAELVEADESLEASIIKISGDSHPYFPLARDLPEVGEEAFTFSNARNSLRVTGTPSFSLGMISGVYEVENLGGESVYSGVAIETTAAINPGSDGGPIINQAGQLCAIISLNVSPARWQGVGVPTKVLLDRMAAFKGSGIKPDFGPLAGRESVETKGLAKQAKEVAQYLAAIEVSRKFPVEMLPRQPWNEFEKSFPDFSKKPAAEQQQLTEAFYEAERLLEVNQLLRRSSKPATGLVISAEGHILTSDFNLADELAFVEKSTSKPRRFVFKGKLDDLVKDPQGGYDRVPNPVQKVFVTLANGEQHEAKILARHAPLGVALLKIEKSGLKHLDLKTSSALPQLGMTSGILGVVDGQGVRYTLNPGVVSAPLRNRGLQFQTDALINYGNSGGPVIGEDGKFLGIASSPIEPRTVQGKIFSGQELLGWAIAPNSGVGMAARSDKIVEALEQLLVGKSTLVIPGPYLGVGPDPTRVFSTEVVLGSVSPGSPADLAGLKRGDQLLAVNGEELSNWRDLTEHLSQFKPGDKLEVKVQRTGIIQKLQINGKSVSNEAELQALLKTLKTGEKFEGVMVSENVKTVTITLGERK